MPMGRRSPSAHVFGWATKRTVASVEAATAPARTKLARAAMNVWAVCHTPAIRSIHGMHTRYVNASPNPIVDEIDG
ncbi:hypothetical protein PTI98_000175 [Pleurotus ostreatus]|nr:hypothetical protein PTI98_000175 [Pleurotus ostreatus]